MVWNDTAPPARGRPREFDTDEVVERAMNTFWTNGYHGTSLPNLLAATGLSRGSLYSAFGDKRGLFQLSLDRYVEDALARFDDELNSQEGAVSGLRACVAGYIDRTTGEAGRRGCLVVATAMELASQDPDVEKKLGRFFRSAEARLTRAFEQVRAEGALADGVEPASAAKLLLGMVEGIRVIAKTGIDRSAWHHAAATLLSSLLR